MSDQFNWHIEDEHGPEIPPDQGHGAGARWLRWLGTAVLILAAWWGWQANQARLARVEADLQTQAQKVLDLQHSALLAGDGDLFFSHLADDPAWRAAQLQPANQAMYRQATRVTAVEPHGEFVWANLAWTTADGASRQRIAFFRNENGRMLHVPTDPVYWGRIQSSQYPWGTLKLRDIDQTWREEIARFVQATVAATCTGACQPSPLTVAVTTDFGETAVPDTIHVPSPRLLGLDGSGAPAPLFWDTLGQKIRDRYTAVTIHFALPPLLPVGIHQVDYERAAAAFMARTPQINVELHTLDAIPTDPAELAGFDGAAFAPTPALIAAGAVQDLTDLAQTDPDFYAGDFYEQIWQGAWWRDRLWFMPQAAEMQVLYYDRNAYDEAELAEPSLRWTWSEMAAHLAALDAALPFQEAPFPNYRFYDVTPDTLYAHALSHSTHEALTISELARTLDWYVTLTQHPRLMPNVAVLTDEERQHSRVRWWATIWVDRLVYYEHRIQLVGNMGVASFPGSEVFDGVTPLHVYGSFMTGHSQHPQAVWAWLRFLSYQETAPRYRHIPARMSVAQTTNYWAMLPRPLNEAVRAAFPFARSVTLMPQPAFDWELLTAVTTGQKIPLQAAQQPVSLPWFYQKQ